MTVLDSTSNALLGKYLNLLWFEELNHLGVNDFQVSFLFGVCRNHSSSTPTMAPVQRVDS